MNIGPIPKLPTVEGRKQVRIRESFFRDPLVPIGLFTQYSRHLFVDPIYSGLCSTSPYKHGEVPGSLFGGYLRKSVAERLVAASHTLHDRHMFLVWDAYRPVVVQKTLFEYFVQKLISTRGGIPDDHMEEAQRFVSLPSEDKNQPSPHSTGGVVDLTIIEFTEKGWIELQKLNAKLLQAKNAQERFDIEAERFYVMRTESSPLETGTLFDEVSPETNLYFYEESAIKEADLVRRNNRRYLFHVLWDVGFVGYEEEWWHYSYGDQFWGKKFDRKARFSSAVFNSACIRYEKMMKETMPKIEEKVPEQEVRARHFLR